MAPPKNAVAAMTSTCPLGHKVVAKETMATNCPKCQLPVTDETQTCPSCGQTISQDGAKPEHAPLNFAQRLAGIALLLNGLFLGIEAVYFSQGAVESRTYSSIMVSLVIGGLLVAGIEKALIWAKISVIAGAVLYTAQYVVAKDYFMSAFQLAFSIGLLLLLFGRPQRIRIGVAAILLMAYFGLEVLGLQQEFTGQHFLTSQFVKARNDLEPIEGNTIRGIVAPYSFEVDGDHWMAMTQEGIRAENSVVERWLVQPKFDAHLFTIPEVLEEGDSIPLTDLVDAVIANGREGSDQFTVNEQKDLPSHPGTGVFLDATVVFDGDPYHFNYGIYSIGNTAVQVVCYAFEESFSHIQKDCSRAIESFALH